MILLALVWVAGAILQAMIYADRPVLALPARRWLLTSLSALDVIVAILLISHAWQTWLLAIVLLPYRLVNAARFMYRHLPLPQLNSVALRAQIWLSVLQALCVLICGLIHGMHLGYVALFVLALGQLVATLLLLRSSARTWRHAEPFRRAEPLTDKQLPSLSILVPARNETDALQVCLERLVASDYSKLEIIVLDDASTNRRTPEIIKGFARAGVRFVASSAPAENNWLAKNWAYERLRAEASGELLLFCGVDAQFGPRTIRQLVEVLLYRQKDMLSVLPLRSKLSSNKTALLQPMRYYWELCLPRRFFKRPPVLSTCWLVRATMLDRVGGFAAVSRSITPEAHFARQAVVTDAYSFIRSNSELALFSAKPASEQYATSVRTRYPQLHRRLELVALTMLLEATCSLGPIVGLCLSGLTIWPTAYAMIWGLAVACLLVTYYFVAVGTRLNKASSAWLVMPLAFATDIIMLHISMYKYEFSQVEWKGRDVAGTVMHGRSLVVKE